MRILVTGGAGFIGSHYVHYVLHTYPSDEVIVLDALTYAGNPENLRTLKGNSRFKFVKGDICDADLVQKLVQICDAVVHVAAESHVDRSIHDASAFIRTNVLGTQTLLDACRVNGNKRFHHVSTDEVYGSLDDQGLFYERSPYNPRSPYSASKAASDHLVRAQFHTNDAHVTISNGANTYGPNCYPEKLIPLAVTNLLEGKKIPLYGDGQHIRDWLYVGDHAAGIDACLRKGSMGESYCIGARTERTNEEVIQMILFEMGLGRDMIEYVKDRPGHDRRYGTDPTKAEQELGWHPATPFLHGLRKTINWYNGNESWWKPLKAHV